jgi:hypothetical protein
MMPSEAIKIIGTTAEDDYILQPTRHADQYDGAAPAFVALLRSGKLSGIAGDYQHRDELAIHAQRYYTTLMERANLAVLATAVLSAFMMSTQILGANWPDARWAVTAFGVLSAVSGAFAAMWLYRVREGKLLEAWMKSRAAAETARLSYFAALAEPPAQGAPDPGFDLLRLEYFRRYQLEVQKNYYRLRGADHQRAADKTLRLGSYAISLSTLSATMSASLAVTGGTAAAAALAAVAVVGAALSAYAGASEAMSQNRRNAERYDRSFTALNGLGARLDEVRSAVAGGNTKALTEFVAAVNDQISLEHRQWLEASEATKAAAARLEDALRKAAGKKD